MYIVKHNGKKISRKEFKQVFTTYDAAKNAIRRYLRSIDQYVGGFKSQGYSIEGIK